MMSPPRPAAIKASEAALVQAVYANGKVTVNIRRLGQGEAPSKTSVDVPLLQTVSTTYPAAAQAAVGGDGRYVEGALGGQFQCARHADRRCESEFPQPVGRDPDGAVRHGQCHQCASGGDGPGLCAAFHRLSWARRSSCATP